MGEAENRNYFIAGEDDGDLGQLPQSGMKGEQELPEEFKRLRDAAQSLLDSYRPLFLTFSGDASLSFKFGNGFYINLKTGEVSMDLKWFMEQEYSRVQIIWANLHELGHFLEELEDPEGGQAENEYLIKAARETGGVLKDLYYNQWGNTHKQVLDQISENMEPVDPEDLTGEKLNPFEFAALSIRHRFFNIFRDIYVNNLVREKAPAFEAGSGAEEVKQLYGVKLFPGTDYSQNPRHTQFLDSFLRQEMVPDENVTLGDEVREAVAGQPVLYERETSLKEIIDQRLKPKNGQTITLSQRNAVLMPVFEPIYLKLLKQDFAEVKLPEPKLAAEGEAGQDKDGKQGRPQTNPFGQKYKNYADKNPDKFSGSQRQKWAAGEKDKQKKRGEEAERRKQKDAMTPTQTAARNADQARKQFMDKHGISRREMKEFETLLPLIEPYRKQMLQIFNAIIYGKTVEYDREKTGYFPTGELSIPKVIERWPEIASGHYDNQPIMERQETLESQREKLEILRVRLVLDLSGSMDVGKSKMVKLCYLLVSLGLRDFNDLLEQTRARTKSKMTVEVQTVVFGGEAKEIQGLSQMLGQEDMPKIIKNLSELNSDMGGTGDFKALGRIANSLTEEDRELSEKKKLLDLLYFVSDGGSDDWRTALKELQKLLSSHIRPRAWQVGKVTEDEATKFDAVWNFNPKNPLGNKLGDDISLLPGALYESLVDVLKQIEI